MRRHSVESNGSAAREFNAYHQYRQQLPSQSDVNSSDEAEREICQPKHHNPSIEAATSISRDHLAPTELRQRVCNLHNVNTYILKLFAQFLFHIIAISLYNNCQFIYFSQIGGQFTVHTAQEKFG